jgi:hypothetical protein
LTNSARLWDITRSSSPHSCELEETPMQRPELTRRDFHRMSMAALGGIVAGTAAGCAKEPAAPAPGGGESAGTTAGTGAETPVAADVNLLLEEPHVCRGLNTCKGKGKGGDNECAGRGACATADAHTCHYENKCKGQGGCGETAGRNACAGKGECAVPLAEDTRLKVRKAFEEAMQAAGKTVGEAPPEG